MDIPRIGIDVLEPRARTLRQRLRLWICGGAPAARLGWLRQPAGDAGQGNLGRADWDQTQFFARSLGVSYEQFAQDLQAAHFSRHRAEILAAYRALPPQLRPKGKPRGGTLTPSGARIYCDPRLPGRRKG